MQDENEIIIELLREILGDEKKHYESKSQVSWNCPKCDEGKNKGNLEVNIEKSVFHCWSCGDENDMHGTLGKLFDLFGTKKQKKVYKLLQPDEIKPKEEKKVKVKLPEGCITFKDSNPIYPVYKQAYTYLKNRGITDNIIEKYNIGFCDTGSHIGRIIIPSYDTTGKLNYYIARSWSPTSKAKYKNPDSPKDAIIFNESLIDWDKDIYLVEGVFDGIFIENSIPMLGKHMSDLLFHTLYEKAKGNIIVALDGDAYQDGLKLYHTLNGGDLYGRIKIVKLPKDKDIADLRGKIDEYYVTIK